MIKSRSVLERRHQAWVVRNITSFQLRPPLVTFYKFFDNSLLSYSVCQTTAQPIGPWICAEKDKEC